MNRVLNALADLLPRRQWTVQSYEMGWADRTKPYSKATPTPEHRQMGWTTVSVRFWTKKSAEEFGRMWCRAYWADGYVMKTRVVLVAR